MIEGILSLVHRAALAQSQKVLIELIHIYGGRGVKVDSAVCVWGDKVAVFIIVVGGEEGHEIFWEGFLQSL